MQNQLPRPSPLVDSDSDSQLTVNSSRTTKQVQHSVEGGYSGKTTKTNLPIIIPVGSLVGKGGDYLANRSLVDCLGIPGQIRLVVVVGLDRVPSVGLARL